MGQSIMSANAQSKKINKTTAADIKKKIGFTHKKRTKNSHVDDLPTEIGKIIHGIITRPKFPIPPLAQFWEGYTEDQQLEQFSRMTEKYSPKCPLSLRTFVEMAGDFLNGDKVITKDKINKLVNMGTSKTSSTHIDEALFERLALFSNLPFDELLVIANRDAVRIEQEEIKKIESERRLVELERFGQELETRSFQLTLPTNLVEKPQGILEQDSELLVAIREKYKDFGVTAFDEAGISHEDLISLLAGKEPNCSVAYSLMALLEIDANEVFRLIKQGLSDKGKPKPREPKTISLIGH